MTLINVEIVLKKYSSESKQSSIISIVKKFLETSKIRPNTVITSFEECTDVILYEIVQYIIIDDVPEFEDSFVNFSTANIQWFVYTLNTLEACNQTDDSQNNEEETVLASHLVVPSQSLYNLWENLHYDGNIKENLLQYAQTIMKFSDKGVDSNIITCNKVILLHGPPGTGKTSLCKALAHKLSIRLQHRYSSGLIVEINAHSLFSKWFSESGKLVTKMFTKISELLENDNVLVCVLIDEVESLAHAREISASGVEPSDSLRAVNAVLTQIDQIKKHPNVLILATSNLTQSIDVAFIDRADVKQYLGPPSVPAIYKIYKSCIVELIKKQIVTQDEEVELIGQNIDIEATLSEYTKQLMHVSNKSVGLSGRSLRKIPFLAHALFANSSSVCLGEFLNHMESAVEREFCERQNLCLSNFKQK